MKTKLSAVLTLVAGVLIFVNYPADESGGSQAADLVKSSHRRAQVGL
jgi:hypothetical protein